MIKNLLDVAFGENSSNSVDSNFTVKIKGLSIDYSYNGPRGKEDKPAEEKGVITLEDLEINGDLKTTMSGLVKMVMDIGDVVRSPRQKDTDNTNLNTNETTQVCKNKPE